MNIVLTGASKGIGYSTAVALASNKITNLVLISRNINLLETLKAHCSQINPKLNVVLLNKDLKELVSSRQSIEGYIDLDYIDVVINNAGLLINKPFEELNRQEISESFKVNYEAPFLLIQGLINKLNKDTWSHVVNISSMGGYQGSSKFPGLSVYSSSKAALANLTECLAAEYADTNLKFNCLALGAVQTEMLNAAFPGYKAPISADQMGKFIAEFALKGHEYYNGKILPVSLSTP